MDTVVSAVTGATVAVLMNTGHIGGLDNPALVARKESNEGKGADEEDEENDEEELEEELEKDDKQEMEKETSNQQSETESGCVIS